MADPITTLQDRVTYLEKLMAEHLGPRAAATRPNQPHTEYATITAKTIDANQYAGNLFVWF